MSSITHPLLSALNGLVSAGSRVLYLSQQPNDGEWTQKLVHDRIQLTRLDATHHTRMSFHHVKCTHVHALAVLNTHRLF